MKSVKTLNVFSNRVLITRAAIAACVWGRSVVSVCLSVCPCSNRKTAWAINTKLVTRILYSRRSACIDQSRGQKVKVKRLRKPSWSHGC